MDSKTAGGKSAIEDQGGEESFHQELLGRPKEKRSRTRPTPAVEETIEGDDSDANSGSDGHDLPGKHKTSQGF